MSRMRVELSGKKDTLANRVATELIPRVNTMQCEEIKSTFISYLEDENLSISQESRRKYTMNIEKFHNTNHIRKYIYDLYLKTSGMGTF